jgi:adenosine deaminase
MELLAQLTGLNMESESEKAFLRDLPKVELHLHLEGAIPLHALWELAKKYGTAKELGSFHGLREKLIYEDFSHFINTWIWLGQHLKEYQDYTYIASEVGKDLLSQGIFYAEILYSPTRDSAKHLDPQKITEAVFQGLHSAGEEFSFNLIADMIRDNGPDEAMKLVESLQEMTAFRPVGIGIGGSEHLYPLEPYREVFAKAREYGFGTTAHAGEVGDCNGIWTALKVLNVNRIGHGVRAIDDPNLIAYLKENQVPIEVCITSNLRTSIVRDIKEHPVKYFFDSGLKVTLNTDDPQMFNTSLSQEYYLVMENFGLSRHHIRILVENAIDSAWCSKEIKLWLRGLVNSYFQKSAFC